MIELSPELLLLAGPWLLAGMAWLETSLPVGLMVPAGLALALGTFLAQEGLLSLPEVLVASGGGALAGDWTGYWLGRLRGTSVFHRVPGPVGRLVRRYDAPTGALIRRRPFWAVTVGRTVSFVRTLMPAAAGRSHLPFGRFVAFDLIGVTAWLALYVGVGIVAGASWRAASGLVGTGWALVAVVGVTVAVVVARIRRRRSVFQVGLTGNAASGKSTVAALWEREGIPVVRADELARQAVAPGTEALDRVVELFGDAMLTDTGELDRPKLRERVFADPEARARLEAVLHPRIAELRSAWVADRAGEGHRLVVSEIPLLFEAGLEESVDRIVLVDAPRELLVARMVRERGLDPDEANAILDAQGDPEPKRARAHHLVENAGTLEALEARAAELLAVLRQEAGA
jgi:dephospho-CoA kinase